jgi:hypothetical protein
MSARFITLVLVVGGMWLLQPMSAHGQITASIDQNGRVVYINADPPMKRQAHAGSKVIENTSESRTTASQPSASLTNAPNQPVDQDQSLDPMGPARLESIVNEAAERNNLDPALVKAVIGTESGWNPGAISPKGALGLMQLEPETAGRFGVSNAFDPVQNVNGGTRYLRSLLDRYNGDLEKSLAAYNAGEGAVERYGGVPRYRETRAYVQKVTNAYFQPGSGRDPQIWSPPRPAIRRTVDENGRVVFTNE